MRAGRFPNGCAVLRVLLPTPHAALKTVKRGRFFDGRCRVESRVSRREPCQRSEIDAIICGVAVCMAVCVAVCVRLRQAPHSTPTDMQRTWCQSTIRLHKDRTPIATRRRWSAHTHADSPPLHTPARPFARTLTCVLACMLACMCVLPRAASRAWRHRPAPPCLLVPGDGLAAFDRRPATTRTVPRSCSRSPHSWTWR